MSYFSFFLDIFDKPVSVWVIVRCTSFTDDGFIVDSLHIARAL
jgi:hypothetical protein